MKANNTGEVARTESRAQINQDGYTGGYIVKAAPVGAYELRKCMNRMEVLRRQIEPKLTPEDQTKTVVRQWPKTSS